MKRLGAPLVLLCLLGAALTACSASDDPKSEFPYGRVMPDVNKTVPFRVWTHCGIEFTQIGKRQWKADGLPVQFQGASAPTGWGEWQEGQLTLTSPTTAAFVTRGTTITYVIQPGTAEPQMCE